MRAAKIVYRLAATLLAFAISAVICQDFLIFPGAANNLFFKRQVELPEGITEHRVSTTDGNELSLWELEPRKMKSKRPIVLILHGNGGDVSSFLRYQQWFADRGFKSYDMDYRGYGSSTGWLTEANIYSDALEVAEFIAARESVDSDEIVILGISVGTGPAAYLASKLQSKVLMLDSGYSSIPDVVAGMPVYRYLTRFLNFRFPTTLYLSELYRSCVILIHGKLDRVIPFDNLERLAKSVPKGNRLMVVASETGDHTSTFFEQSVQIEQALDQCIEP